MINGLEIFSGAGGLAKGLSSININHLGFIEFNKHACNTLRKNFNSDIVFESDIKEVNPNQFDKVSIIAGGPPCQPFSIGGKHKGQNDNRDMFPETIRFIREVMPKVFIFENVKGLLRKSFSTYFNYIILQLNYPNIYKRQKEDWLAHIKRLEKIHTNQNNYQDLKYNIIYRLINSADYGIPQKRERVFIVGIRNDLNISWSFPNPTHSYDSLIYNQCISMNYWKRHRINNIESIAKNQPSSDKVKNLELDFSLFGPTEKPWVTIRDIFYDLPNPNSKNNKIIDHQYRDGAKKYPGHDGSYIDLPAKTLKAGDHGVPGGENMLRNTDDSVRYFTVFEAKRLQTFPDDYVITGSWTEAMRQIGNAVPVKLVKHLFSNLISKINS